MTVSASSYSKATTFYLREMQRLKNPLAKLVEDQLRQPSAVEVLILPARFKTVQSVTIHEQELRYPRSCKMFSSIKWNEFSSKKIGLELILSPLRQTTTSYILWEYWNLAAFKTQDVQTNDARKLSSLPLHARNTLARRTIRRPEILRPIHLFSFKLHSKKPLHSFRAVRENQRCCLLSDTFDSSHFQQLLSFQIGLIMISCITLAVSSCACVALLLFLKYNRCSYTCCSSYITILIAKCNKNKANSNEMNHNDSVGPETFRAVTMNSNESTFGRRETCPVNEKRRKRLWSS